MRPSRLIIQCRLGSSRLPGKALLHVGGMPAVVLCALRAGNSGRETVIATSEDPANDLVALAAENNGLRVVRGDEEDVLGRFVRAIEDLAEDAIVVRLTADNLFPDGAFVDEMITQFEAQSADYLAPAFPEAGLPYGMMAEVTTASALRRSARESSLPADREHVTQWIRNNGRTAPFFPAEVGAAWKGKRATIDNLEDYETVARIFAGEEQPLKTPWRKLCENLSRKQSPAAGDSHAGLVLGMANLGIPGYGRIKHSFSPSASSAVIKGAIRRGVRSFDCAQAYGEAETLAGLALRSSASNLAVFTKLDPLHHLDHNSSEREIAAATEASVWQSCAKLGLTQLPVLMLHRAEQLVWAGGAAWKKVLQLQKAGVIREVGVSVYTPDEARLALKEESLQHLQLPVNLLDRRWTAAGLDRDLAVRKNVSVMARSVFLQGLLTNGPKIWPTTGGISAEERVRQLDEISTKLSRKNRADLCLAYVRGLPWVQKIVLGVENLAQLDEILDLYATPILSGAERSFVENTFSKIPDSLLDPREWTRS